MNNASPKGGSDRVGSMVPKVTVAFLLERQVSLHWHEAVAIVLEIAEVLERSGPRALPKHEHIAITPAGSVEFLKGGQSDHHVAALARTLNVLLPTKCPTQLRLIVSRNGPSGASYESVSEFSEALKYFERPGRRTFLTDIHERARQTPLPAKSATPKKEKGVVARAKTPRRLRRFLVPTTAVFLLGVAGAASVAYLEQRDPGSVTGPARSIQDLGADAWETARDLGGEMRENAPSDLSTLLGRIRRIGSDGEDADILEEGDENAEQPADVTPPRERRTTVLAADASTSALIPEPTPDVPAPAALATDASTSAPIPEPAPDVPTPAVLATDASTSAPIPEPAPDVPAPAVLATDASTSAPLPEPTPEVPAPAATQVEPLLSGRVFDSDDANVTPPGLRVPSVSEGDSSSTNFAVVEAVVSASGEVETVRLIAPPRSIHEATILNAVRTWRFRPAMKDGQPVWYRHLIPVALSR